MNKNVKVILLATILWLSVANISNACTNLLISRGATTDSACYISYAADSHTLYGELYYWAAADHTVPSFMDIYEWDTGKFLGKINQIAHTFNVVGNMNEYQVAIGETTFGGLDSLQSQPAATIDYGSLIYIALQRSKTAREAIKVMAELVAQYGYASEGESFSISDPNEVWIFEMIGKGKPYIPLSQVVKKNAKKLDSKGAVWVAVRIPDGCISGHANHARINFFTPENLKTSVSSKNLDKIFIPTVEFIYAADVISFAREKGYYNGKDADFSFSDVYNPIWDANGKMKDYGGLRFCEARVWSAFRRVNKDMDKYFSYINGDSKDRMPLYIKPDNKLSLKDVIALMRDHFEGTPYDMTLGVGAGPFKCPYRWRPMEWKAFNGKDTLEYLHERAVSTQQTGFSFVAQSRRYLPNPIGGILWFGVDDTYSTVYSPMYCGITKVPDTFREGNGSITEFTWNSAFWVFNWVANYAYSRYSDMIVDIKKKQSSMENNYMEMVQAYDLKASNLYKTSPQQAIEMITQFSTQQGDKTTKEWEKLGQYLLVKYMDGNVKNEKDGKFELNGTEHPLGKHPKQPPYPADWYKRIVDETKDTKLMK